jgi:DNA mismatch repair protein MLH3
MSIPMAKISSSSSVQVSDPASASAPSSTPFSGQTFSRESLARAEFVAQVDRKYLLAKLPVAGERRSPLATTQTLVLVDQHAASERVRVERFLDATVGNVARGESIATIRCGRDEADDPDEAERAPRSVENRIGIVVGRREYELARQYRTVFARWGFTLAFDDDDDEAPPPSPSFSPTTGGDGGGGGDYHQIWLESVPDLVSNRLLTKTKDSHLAQDLVRSFVAHLEGNGPGVAGDVEYTAAGGDGGGGAGRRRGRGGWTSAIKDAPPVLVELLNSKACRGAIMFNDGEPSLLSSCALDTATACDWYDGFSKMFVSGTGSQNSPLLKPSHSSPNWPRRSTRSSARMDDLPSSPSLTSRPLVLHQRSIPALTGRA